MGGGSLYRHLRQSPAGSTPAPLVERLRSFKAAQRRRARPQQRAAAAALAQQLAALASDERGRSGEGGELFHRLREELGRAVDADARRFAEAQKVRVRLAEMCGCMWKRCYVRMCAVSVCRVIIVRPGDRLVVQPRLTGEGVSIEQSKVMDGTKVGTGTVGWVGGASQLDVCVHTCVHARGVGWEGGRGGTGGGGGSGPRDGGQPASAARQRGRR